MTYIFSYAKANYVEVPMPIFTNCMYALTWWRHSDGNIMLDYYWRKH